MTLRTLPNADNATKTERARSARVPKTLRKNEAAKMRPEDAISSLGTAAKYAIWSMVSLKTSRPIVETYIDQHVNHRDGDQG